MLHPVPAIPHIALLETLTAHKIKSKSQLLNVAFLTSSDLSSAYLLWVISPILSVYLLLPH